MNFMAYIERVFEPNVPIFEKNLRIGGMSKSAVKQCFYRAAKSGDLIRVSNGVYAREDKQSVFPGVAVSADEIVRRKYLYGCNPMPGLENLFVIGYYSGLTLLNLARISSQVPAVIEVVTNNTKSRKRVTKIRGATVILRKPKTEITFQNWQALQFLDLFSFLEDDEVREYEKAIIDFANRNEIKKCTLEPYLSLYGMKTLKKLMEGGIWNALAS